MKILSFSDFRQAKTDDTDKLLPITLTINGEPRWVVSRAEDVMVIGDLHPRVQKQLKALEQLARKGMPKDEKIYSTPPRDRFVESVGIEPQGE